MIRFAREQCVHTDEIGNSFRKKQNRRQNAEIRVFHVAVDLFALFLFCEDVIWWKVEEPKMKPMQWFSFCPNKQIYTKQTYRVERFRISIFFITNSFGSSEKQQCMGSILNGASFP